MNATRLVWLDKRQNLKIYRGKKLYPFFPALYKWPEGAVD